jgi:flagellar M-ring protein FliF
MGELWKNLQELWSGRSGVARVMFVVTVAATVVLTAWLVIWATRSDEQVLFSDLDARDAAAIVTELKRMKVPFRIVDDGTKILVAGKTVHEVRLSLMGRGVPISGGVGFEIFDNKDVGMTESMQRINYQRALQGELARTIMANEQLKSARVHLVVEEGGLFNRDKPHPKAAVSVVLKAGAHLGNEQILGIQRLVAAAVPGLDPSQVTITDQRGIALSTEADTETAGAPATGKLRLKKQADEYLTRKVSEVLDRAFGPGQAIVSVDATLNFDEIHRTEQNIVPLHGRGDEVGAVVRRRESIYRQPSTGAAAVKAVDSTAEHPPEGTGALTSSNEIEYEFSKSADQVLSTPGGIRRISVGVIVPQSVTDDQLSRIRDIVGAAVGFNSERGDAITVQPLSRIMTPKAPVVSSATADTEAPVSTAAKARSDTLAWNPTGLATYAGPGLLAILLVGFWLLRGRRRERSALERRLSVRERQELLAELKAWIDAEKTAPSGASRP